MNNKYKYLIKNTSVLTISNFSSKILVFLLVPLYTNVLSTTEYGVYDLITTTVSLLFPILSANIADGVMRFCMDKNTDKRGVVTIGAKFSIIAISSFGIAIIINYFLGFWREISELSVLVFTYFSFAVINQYMTQLARGMEKVKDIAIAGTLGTFSMIVLNIFFLIGLHMHLSGFLTAYIMGQAIPTFYLAVRIHPLKYLEKKINPSLQSEMLHYSIPLIMNQFGWWANSVSDRYAVTWLCGIAQNGIYSVAYKIPAILNTVQGIFVQAWQISAVKEYEENDSSEFYSKTLTVINAVMSILCAILILSTKLIAHFLYSKEFYEAWKFVPLLLVSGVINTASGVIGPILTARKNSKALAISALYGASVNVVLNILLIYLMGVQGAAIATEISSFVIFYLRLRYVGKSIETATMRLLLASWGILTLQSICMIYTDAMYLQVLFIVSLLLIYKLEIAQIINVIIRKK